jgi:hypothetical protein
VSKKDRRAREAQKAEVPVEERLRPVGDPSLICSVQDLEMGSYASPGERWGYAVGKVAGCWD